MSEYSTSKHQIEEEITKEMLGVVVYAIITRHTQKWYSDEARRVSLLLQHIETFIELEREGKVFLAGPFVGDPDRPDGMIVVRAESLEEAQAIADMDVFHQEGYRTYTIEPWMINEGNLGINLRFSKSRFSIS